MKRRNLMTIAFKMRNKNIIIVFVVVSLLCGTFGNLSYGKGISLDKTDLEVWNSPDFKRRFTESYIAETEIEPRLTIDERKQMQDILDLMSSDDMEKAIDRLKKGQKNSGNAVFDFTLANIYFQLEDYEPAQKEYMVAVEKYPKFLRAWKNLGLIQVRQGNYSDAVDTLTRVLELGGADSTTYGILGFSYSYLDNDLAAETAYRLAIMLKPDTIDWKLGLARSLFKQQRFNEAVALCDSLIEAYPNRSDIWLLQANAYIGMGKPLKAAEIYEVVDELKKSTPESLNMLADIYINEQLYDLAVGAYIKAIEKSDSDNPERAIRGAKILAASGEFISMRRLVEAIELTCGDKLQDSTLKELLKLKARLAVAQDSSDEHAEVLQKIIDLDPLDGEAIMLLGQHYKSKSDIEKAIFYYERAASIDAFEADAKISIAQIYVGEGKYDDALPLLRRAQIINHRENVQKYLEQVERVAKNK